MVMKDVPAALWGHQQVLSPSRMGSTRTCEFVWAEPSKGTLALILTHCSCLFSSFCLLTGTLEIRLVKRQWRLWVLCLLSLNHPATSAHSPCPAPNSWETNKQTERNGLEQSEEYVTFSLNKMKQSYRSSERLFWCYKWKQVCILYFHSRTLQGPSLQVVLLERSHHKAAPGSNGTAQTLELSSDSCLPRYPTNPTKFGISNHHGGII